MGLFHKQLFTILLYFFSVLIAHNGFVYDFPLLFAEVISSNTSALEIH